MKLKEGFILRPYGDKWVAVGVGNARNQNLMLSMNKTGAFLWECLQEDSTEEALLAQMTAHYQIPAKTANSDLQQLLSVLRTYDLLEE